MSVIYVLIAVSITIAAFFLFLFIKAVQGGQFDDKQTPAIRILFEDEIKNSDSTHKQKQNK